MELSKGIFHASFKIYQELLIKNLIYFHCSLETNEVVGTIDIILDLEVDPVKKSDYRLTWINQEKFKNKYLKF
jgi:hypothetical protein